MERYGLVAALLLAVLGIGLAIHAPAAFAENLGPGGARIIMSDTVIGPYQLLVTSSPEPAQVGPLSIMVRISDPATSTKMLNATVELELVHTESGVVVSGPATHAQAGNAVDYVAHLEMPEAGQWTGRILISGPDGKREVSFIQRVVTQRTFSTAVLFGVPFLALVVVAAGYWFLRGGGSSAKP